MEAWNSDQTKSLVLGPPWSHVLGPPLVPWRWLFDRKVTFSIKKIFVHFWRTWCSDFHKFTFVFWIFWYILPVSERSDSINRAERLYLMERQRLKEGGLRGADALPVLGGSGRRGAWRPPSHIFQYIFRHVFLYFLDSGPYIDFSQVHCRAPS